VTTQRWKRVDLRLAVRSGWPVSKQRPSFGWPAHDEAGLLERNADDLEARAPAVWEREWRGCDRGGEQRLAAAK
jgi:hypothetical protein